MWQQLQRFYLLLFPKAHIESLSSYSPRKYLSIPKAQIYIVSGCIVNILSSVGIIFLNKYIFSHCQIKTLSLTAAQMIFTSFGLVICLRMNTFARKIIPVVKVLPLSISFCVSVVFTNLSLEYNTIGTYQLFKVLTTPLVAFISWQYYRKRYSRMVIVALILVVVGVWTYSVNDVKLTLFGTLIASVGVLSASLYQIWVGESLKELQMDSQQLLFYQAPLSAILLVPVVLYMEVLPPNRSSEDQQTTLTALLASCIVAFSVNLSVYWVIKNTSALSYNMISQAKTVLVLVGGFIIFRDSISFQQFLHILLTLFGLFSYAFVKMSEQNQLSDKRWSANAATHIV